MDLSVSQVALLSPLAKDLVVANKGDTVSYVTLVHLFDGSLAALLADVDCLDPAK